MFAEWLRKRNGGGKGQVRAPSTDALHQTVVQSQLKIIDFLVECECLIGQLYRTYAMRLEAQRDFWNEMAREEEGHAAVVRSLIKEVESGSYLHNVGTFFEPKTLAIRADIEHLIRKAGDPQLAAESALGAAVKIEMAIIESSFYRTMSSDSEHFIRVASSMRRACAVHTERLRALYNALPGPAREPIPPSPTVRRLADMTE